MHLRVIVERLSSTEPSSGRVYTGAPHCNVCQALGGNFTCRHSRFAALVPPRAHNAMAQYLLYGSTER